MSEMCSCTVDSLQRELLKVAANAPATFSGVAVLLYNSQHFSSHHHCDLRNASELLRGEPYFATLDNGFADLLLTISLETHHCHDGFILVDELGQVTHIAQYFVPPVVPDLIPHSEHGTRFYSALSGSLLPGVTAIGTVCVNGDCFLMQSGRVVFQMDAAVGRPKGLHLVAADTDGRS